MRTPETVIITLEKSCDFTMPSISSDSSFGDTRTYVKSYAPVTLTFAGYSATCQVSSSVTDVSGSAVPSFFTFTPGAPSDTLTFSTNSPANEATYNLKYVLTSTEAPELF